MPDQLHLWSRTPVGVAELADVLEKLHASVQFEHAEVEWWDEAAQLTHFSDILANLKTKSWSCLSGSVWNKTAEVHWRRVGEQFWLVLTSAGVFGDLDETWHFEKDECIRAHDGPKKRTFVLWGTEYIEERDAWVELRIPQEMHYPVPPEIGGVEREYDAACLEVLEYVDAAGQTVAARRCGLSAVRKN